MSKSRNSKRRDALYYDDEIEFSKKDLKKNRERRKEKRMTTALKSKNIRLISQLEEEMD